MSLCLQLSLPVTLCLRTAQARLASRTGHYMPLSLLDSQLEALEPPDEGEGFARLVVVSPDVTARPPAEVVSHVCAALGIRPAGDRHATDELPGRRVESDAAQRAHSAEHSPR